MKKRPHPNTFVYKRSGDHLTEELDFSAILNGITFLHEALHDFNPSNIIVIINQLVPANWEIRSRKRGLWGNHSSREKSSCKSCSSGLVDQLYR